MKSKTTKQISNIPNFKDREEEAKFWETHSITDYLDEFQPVQAKFAKNLSEGITIRFDQPTLNKIREIAHDKGIGPTTLARMWIMDHLKGQTVR